MGNRKPPYLLDSLIVLLNFAGARGNILLYWLLGLTNNRYVLTIVVTIDIMYLMIRFGGINFIKNIGKSFSLLPFYFSLLLLLVNFINTLREGAGFLVSTELVLLILFFGFIVGGLSKDYIHSARKNNTLQLLSRGYCWICWLTVGGIFISFLLDILFGLQKTPITADFLESNIENGSSYYRSFFSILIQDVDTRIPFFQQFGILSGLYHESQVSTHQILPFFILLLGFCEKQINRKFIILSALLFFLFSSSVTNMLVMAVCVLVYFLITSKSKIFGVLTGVGVIAVIILAVIRLDTESIFQDFIIDRLDSDNRSQLYSISMLIWTFSPRTLLGSNFINTEYVMDIMDYGRAYSDVGWIPFFLFVGFIVFFFVNIFKLLSIKNKYTLATGIASLYYILHSAKIGMPMLMQPLLVLLVYLQTIALQLYGRSRTLEKNS